MKNLNDHIIKKITEEVSRLRYGTITIKVHDSKITQIEMTEKRRFDDIAINEEGGGI